MILLNTDTKSSNIGAFSGRYAPHDLSHDLLEAPNLSQNVQNVLVSPAECDISEICSATLLVHIFVVLKSLYILFETDYDLEIGETAV